MSGHELPDFITLLAERFRDVSFLHYLYVWRTVIYSLIVAFVILLFFAVVARKRALIPGRLQNILEVLLGGVDDFVCGILGRRGRQYTPFIGTLFFYILSMNLIGLVPFFKSATADWSITLALALCVFCYVQYSALKELGFVGYLDHLAGKPRGVIAFSVVLPLLMFFVHLLSELIKPISLSLRLRSNIWGGDLLISILAGFGLKGTLLLFINTLAALLAGIVQAVVFCLLTTIYFAVILPLEEEHRERS